MWYKYKYMKTLIRQLSLEAIENCITCLNFSFDEVIFVGDEDIIDEENKNIEKFLREYCKVKTISFKRIYNNSDFKKIKEIIENCIKDNDYYFDLTGGEGLCQAAMVELSYKHNIPMHIYDVKRGICVNVDDDISGSIFDVKQRKIKLTIDSYIRMVGGVINNGMHKDNKTDINAELFKLKDMYLNDWNCFCGAIQKVIGNSLYVSCDDATDICLGISLKTLYEIIEEGVKLKVFKGFRSIGKRFCFYFVNDEIKHAITDTGSLFEQMVYKNEVKEGVECQIGVHLDWDGIINSEDGDVLNEIDVLKLEGNILTFISCKDTKKLNNSALYELESVARRFGGNYAKMKIATRAQITDITRGRAKEMGIEIEEY